MNLLFYDFTIGHRPDKMMREVDCLNRYNYLTAQWRKLGEGLDEKPRPFSALVMRPSGVAFSNVAVQERGPTGGQRTLLAKAFQPRTVYVLSAVTNTTECACRLAGIRVDVAAKVEDRHLLDFHPILREQQHDIGYVQTDQLMKKLQSAGCEQRVDWIIAIDGGDQDASWRDGGLEKFKNLVKLAAEPEHGLKALVVFGSQETGTAHQSWIERELEWQSLTIRVQATKFGSAIESQHCVTVATVDPEVLETLTFEESPPGYIGEHLDPLSAANVFDDDVALADLPQVWRPERPDTTADLGMANTVMEVQRIDDAAIGARHRTPVFDPRFPAPPLTARANRWYNSPFAIEIFNRRNGKAVRGIRIQELLRIFGFDDDRIDKLLFFNEGELIDLLTVTPPADLVATVLCGLWEAEQRSQQPRTRVSFANPIELHGPVKAESPKSEEAALEQALRAMPMRELNQVTTLPVPSMEDWKQAIQFDADLSKVVSRMEANQDINRRDVVEKKYFDEWKQNRLEVEDGMLFRYEASKRASLRQIRTKVVPRTLRQKVFAALHPSPMAGHSGYEKTYWRIAARHWWPSMATDIRKLCLACAMCRVVNQTSHEAQQIMRTIFSDVPFDVVVMDIWKPGRFASKKRGKTGALTCLDIMTAFAGAEFIETETALEAALKAFQAFFVTRGLPKLVIFDQGGSFAGFILRLCEILNISTYAVTKENHRAILCERFHRFLNKIERIHAAECQTFEDWIMGVLFAMYAWNSAPVDGTDVIRSVAAIGRDFPFPIDLNEEQVVPRDHFNTAETALEHLSVAFPMLKRQQELLSMLQEERREYHRELKNASKNMKTFTPGELVIVRKQVKTNADAGEPAKLMIRARGPYRVLEEIRPGTYKIQKLPFAQGLGRRGKPYKESSARMEKLPSTITLHKNADGLDTRLATYANAAVPCPLEKTLGIVDFGRYSIAPPDRLFAYDKIADLWPDIQLEQDDESEEEDGEIVEEPQPPVQSLQEAARQQAQELEHPVAPRNPRARNETEGQGRAVRPRLEQRKKRQPSPEVIPRGILKRSKRQAQLPERYRDEPQGPQLGGTPGDKLKKLFNDVKRSKDKLFLIRHRAQSTGQPKWHLVQVLLDETDRDDARTQGKYQVRFQIRHSGDSKHRSQRHCRYWPEIHVLRSNNTFGVMQQVRPEKVEKFLDANQTTAAAYDLEVDLMEHGIIGPFDFVPPNAANGESRTVPEYCWEGLLAAQHDYGIDATNINDVVPLR